MGLTVYDDEFQEDRAFEEQISEKYFSALIKVNDEFLDAVKSKKYDSIKKYLSDGFPISRKSKLFDNEKYLFLSDSMSDKFDEAMYLSSKFIYDLLIKDEYREMFDFLIPHLYSNDTERLFQDLYFRLEYDEKRFEVFFNNLLSMDDSAFNFFGWLKSSFLNKNRFMADKLIDYYKENKFLIVNKRSNYADYSEINAVNYFSYLYEAEDGILKISDFVRTDAVLKYLDLILDDLVERQKRHENFVNYMTENFSDEKDVESAIWTERAMRLVFSKIIVKGSILGLFENYKDVGSYIDIDESLYNIESMRFLILKKFADVFNQKIEYFLFDALLINIGMSHATVKKEDKNKNPLTKMTGWNSISKRGLKNLYEILDKILMLAKDRLDPFELLAFLQERKVDSIKYMDLKNYCNLSRVIDEHNDEANRGSGEKSSGRTKI